MRNIINISLPPKMVEIVEQNIKKEHFASKSEFFRMILRLWMEGEFAKELEESRKEMLQGKGKRLGSLKDLR